MRRSPKRNVDPLEVQLNIHAHVPKSVKLTKTLVDEVVDYWAVHGSSPRGFNVEVVRWRNPSRLKRSDRTWREARNINERNCALIRRALRHGARFTIGKTVRNNKGDR